MRFLYPDVAPYNSVAAAANVHLLTSPAIELLPMRKISVPAVLNTNKTPVLRLNTAHPAWIAARFPRKKQPLGSVGVT